jgi:hypothetical protein
VCENNFTLAFSSFVRFRLLNALSPLSPAHRSLLAKLANPLAVLLVLLPTLAYPFGRDQAVFAYVGQVIARGGMPYRDAWDLKPPGIYLAYAVPALLAHDGAALMIAVRVADLLLAALIAWLLALIAIRLLGDGPDAPPQWGVAVAAGGWYAALYLHGTFWSLAQVEAWANPLVLGAALRLVGPRAETRPKPGALLAVGALLGGAALLKFTAVLPALPFLGWTVWALPGGEKSKRRGFVTLAWVIVGGGLALAVAAAWLAAGGALLPYLDIQRGFVAPYTRLGATGLGERLAALAGHTLGWAGRAWLPVALAAVGFAPTSRWRADGRWLAAGALLAGLLAVWSQGKYFGYHWQTVLPWLALAAAVGTAEVASRLRLPPLVASGLLAALPLVWSGVVHWPDYRDAARYAAGSLPREAWLARFGRPGRGDYAYLSTERAAAYVREHTVPGDRVLVWGFEPSIYLLADRRPSTRFFFNVPVAVRFAPEAWKHEFLADLDAHPPRMLLVLEHDPIPWATGRTDDSAAQLAGWPELAARVRRDYREVAVLEDFRIYQRRPTADPSPGEQQKPDARTP